MVGCQTATVQEERSDIVMPLESVNSRCKTGGTVNAEFRSKTRWVDVTEGVGAGGAGVWYVPGENFL